MISYLPDSNKNSQGEFLKVSGNWLADECFLSLLFQTCHINGFPSTITADSRYNKLNINFVKVQDINRILHSEVFVHTNRQLRASHLVLNCTPFYAEFQDPRVSF